MAEEQTPQNNQGDTGAPKPKGNNMVMIVVVIAVALLLLWWILT